MLPSGSRRRGRKSEGHIVVARFGRRAIILLAAMLPPGHGFAEAPALPSLDEVRLGGSSNTGPHLSPNIELQALFSPLPFSDHVYDPNWSWVFSPRPFVGGSVNVQGKTDQAYAGLAWSLPVPAPFLAEVSAGVVVHNQTLDRVYDDRPSPLSTRFQFRESVAIGYEIDPRWRIMAFLDHDSNGNLGYRNIAVNRFGLLLGGKLNPSPQSAMVDAPSIRPAVAGFTWDGPYVGASVGFAHGAGREFESSRGRHGRAAQLIRARGCCPRG